MLPLVSKPVQYVGGELNATVRDWDGADVRWCLMYPDAYEVGLPNQGLMILYEILNEMPGVLAERSYAVWPDLEALMREHGVPQFTVETHRPVGAFDMLGVSLSTELGYTNMLTALDLAGIPLHAVDRADDAPIVNSPSVLGYDTQARIGGLQHGFGFVLFIQGGKLHMLEGFAWAPENTSNLDLTAVQFEIYNQPVQRLG